MHFGGVNRAPITTTRLFIMKISKIDDIRGFLREGGRSPLSTTVSDFVKLVGDKVDYALCGGLVVGVYGRARGTDDVDMLLRSDSDIQMVINLTRIKFKQNRGHAIIHKETGVEVKLVTPEFINVYSMIIQSAIVHSSMKPVDNVEVPVISKEGLIVLKLGRGNEYDIGDIKNVLRVGGHVDISNWPLKDNEKDLYNKIWLEVSNESKVEDPIIKE